MSAETSPALGNPEAPNPQRPVVLRLRVRYAKRGRLRFTSHRDFSRALERAIRRAGLPIAFSSGFSPHPRISYAGASPTGAASEAEYLEIALTDRVDPATVLARLDEALPTGLDVLEVIPADSGSLADRLEASVWRLELTGVSHVDAAAAVARFLVADEVQVQRMTKKGLRTFDCRAAVERLTVQPMDEAPASTIPEPDSSCAILDLVVQHGTPTVRPDDVIAGLRELCGLPMSAPFKQSRLRQGPLDPRTGTVGDPLAPDRDAYQV